MVNLRDNQLQEILHLFLISNPNIKGKINIDSLYNCKIVEMGLTQKQCFTKPSKREIIEQQKK